MSFRTRPFHVAALAFGLLAGLGLTLPNARGDARSQTINVNEIKEGMKGYGLTVFKGTVPEKFDVEVIGVLHNFLPSQDLILVKTPHPRLNVTKNVKGMSGSPIFFDGGRLAGAYAYSLSSFQAEPVAGITPIAPMLAELHRAIPPGFWPLEGRPPIPGAAKEKVASAGWSGGNDATRFAGEPGSYDLHAHADELAARFGSHKDSGGPVPVATPLMMGGFTERAVAELKKTLAPLGLEPLQGGGGGPAKPPEGAPEHYVDGGSVGVQLARGDLSMMGLGTVTHVEGTKLAGFGHPMMQAGDCALPTTLGRILWIYASDEHSFKVGEAIRPLGALVQDRQSAIVADETKTAPVFPIKVEIRGVDGQIKKTWSFEAAEEKFMSPGILAGALGSVVEATISERRDITWQLHSKLAVRGHGTIDLDDFGVAIGGTPDAGEWGGSRLVHALGATMNNPFEPVHIDGVTATFSVEYARDLLRIRGVEVQDPEIDVGQKARLLVHLVPFVGPEITKAIDVSIPAELAGRDATIDVAPGFDVSPEVAAPESLDDILANEPKEFPPKSLVAQVKVPGQTVTFQGHVATRLPPFALDALRPASSTKRPEPYIGYARTIVPTDRYVTGGDSVRVHVRRVMR